jgi:hypothetical protein
MQFSSSVSLAALVISSLGFLALDRDPVPPSPQRPALVGNPRLCEARYRTWREAHASRDVSFPLAWSRALSTERTSATGSFAFDASTGRLLIALAGIPTGVHYDAWLVDDAAGTSAAPEASDRDCTRARATTSRRLRTSSREPRPDRMRRGWR